MVVSLGDLPDLDLPIAARRASAIGQWSGAARFAQDSGVSAEARTAVLYALRHTIALDRTKDPKLVARRLGHANEMLVLRTCRHLLPAVNSCPLRAWRVTFAAIPADGLRYALSAVRRGVERRSRASEAGSAAGTPSVRGGRAPALWS